MKKVELPESLGWYRDSAQWILGLALGTLGGFVGLAEFSEKISVAGLGLKLTFALGGITVLLAVVGGVFFNLFLAQLGNAMELQQKLDDDIANKRINSGIDERTGKIDRKWKRATKGYGRCYWVLLISFLASLLLFTIVGGKLLFTPAGKKESPQYELAIAPGEAVENQSQIYLVNKDSGELYRLSETSNIWIRIAGTNKLSRSAADFSQAFDRRTNDLILQLNGLRQEIKGINSNLSAQILMGAMVAGTNIAAMTDGFQQIEKAITALTKLVPPNAPAHEINFNPVTIEMAKIQREIEKLTAVLAARQVTLPTTNSPELLLRNTGLFFHIGRSELNAK